MEENPHCQWLSLLSGVCEKDAGVEGFSRRLITYQRGTCFGLYEDAHVAVQMMIRVIKVTIGKGGRMGGSI